jgi:tRNA threonylcarbamoyl adenosine modification protein YeaZ
MRILALEFSPYERSLAVLVDGEVRGFSIDRTPQGTRTFEYIQRALEQANISAPDVECIAVGLGPGSYAGTRIAIAVAQGWQLARGIKLLGISSADAIARKINTTEGIALVGRSIPFHGLANIVFDAQRDQAYAIRYRVGMQVPIAVGDFDLLTHDEEMRRREAGEIFVKADMGPWKVGEEVVILSDARVIGHLAEQRTEFLPGCKLEPVYLRKAEFVKASQSEFRPKK